MYVFVHTDCDVLHDRPILLTGPMTNKKAIILTTTKIQPSPIQVLSVQCSTADVVGGLMGKMEG